MWTCGHRVNCSNEIFIEAFTIRNYHYFTFYSVIIVHTIYNVVDILYSEHWCTTKLNLVLKLWFHFVRIVKIKINLTNGVGAQLNWRK